MRPSFQGVIAVLVLLLLSAHASRAETGPETELHAIGIYEGIMETAGRVHGPEARVHVDRPGASVTLLLTDYGPVRWFVTATPETRIERILLGGHQPERSEVFLNGEPHPDREIVVALGHAYKAEGPAFRAIVGRASELAGVERLAGFMGAYRAPEAGFLVDRPASDDPRLGPDPLAGHLADPAVVPEALRPALAPGFAPQSGARFSALGIEVRRADGSRQDLPATLDVPPVSWGVAAVLDETRGQVYAVSLGGTGYLYRVDLATGTWSVLRDMQQFDASGMLLDVEGDRLILPGGTIDPSQILIMSLAGETTSVPLRPDDLPGFADLYDRGNGRGPGLLPLAVSGDLLLLRADADRRVVQASDGPTSLTWMVDLATGAVQLVSAPAPSR